MMTERRRIANLVSAAFLLHRPVTVVTPGTTYTNVFVVSIADTDEPPDDCFCVLAATPDGVGASGIWCSEVTAVEGVTNEDVVATHVA